MKEIFKDIPGFEGIYQVSNLGKIKSLARFCNTRGGGLKPIKESILCSKLNKDGYPIVNLTNRNLKRTTQKIHQLIALVFLNYKFKSYNAVLDHINNDKTDNHLENLQIISQRENTSKDRVGGTSKHIGVWWNKKDKRWKSCIRHNGKQIYLGYFIHELDAAQAYQDALIKINNGYCI